MLFTNVTDNRTEIQISSFYNYCLLKIVQSPIAVELFKQKNFKEVGTVIYELV